MTAQLYNHPSIGHGFAKEMARQYRQNYLTRYVHDKAEEAGLREMNTFAANRLAQTVLEMGGSFDQAKRRADSVIRQIGEMV